MTTTDLVVDDDLVKSVAFGDDDDLWDVVTSDPFINEFYEATRALVVATHGQLEQANEREDRGLPIDMEWRGRLVSVHNHVNRMLVKVKPLAMDYRRRTNDVRKTDQAVIFRRAIVAHRDALTADDTLEPTEFDLALWEALDEADAL